MSSVSTEIHLEKIKFPIVPPCTPPCGHHSIMYVYIHMYTHTHTHVSQVMTYPHFFAAAALQWRVWYHF